LPATLRISAFNLIAILYPFLFYATSKGVALGDIIY